MLNSGEGPFRCFAAIGDNRLPKLRVLFVSERGLKWGRSVMIAHHFALKFGARKPERGHFICFYL
jgi:hypothetical protein